MTLDRDVFLSLLALDSYNRGKGVDVGGLPESGEIGDASITTQQEIYGDDAAAVLQTWQAAGFYAIAYE